MKEDKYFQNVSLFPRELGEPLGRLPSFPGEEQTFQNVHLFFRKKWSNPKMRPDRGPNLEREMSIYREEEEERSRRGEERRKRRRRKKKKKKEEEEGRRRRRRRRRRREKRRREEEEERRRRRKRKREEEEDRQTDRTETYHKTYRAFTLVGHCLAICGKGTSTTVRRSAMHSSFSPARRSLPKSGVLAHRQTCSPILSGTRSRGHKSVE